MMMMMWWWLHQSINHLFDQILKIYKDIYFLLVFKIIMFFK